ncbi:MAG: polysaccharide deacetylase family protein [Nitrospiraceae bacterium]|nr:MAG: polysaccharide deacetylase family protein [Nitrospiraceae bacterium]
MKLSRLLKNILKNSIPQSLLLQKGNKESKKIALTFDDGPFPEKTDNILDILRRHDIKATFFMIGSAIESNKDLFRKIIDEGHEIGNHFYNHRSVSGRSYEELDMEVSTWEKVVKDIAPLYDYPRLLRFPYGRSDLKSFCYAWRNNWRIVHWSVDSRDLDPISVDVIIETLKSGPISGGDIILLHDDSMHAEVLLEWIIREGLKSGYIFSRISELKT